MSCQLRRWRQSISRMKARHTGHGSSSSPISHMSWPCSGNPTTRVVAIIEIPSHLKIVRLFPFGFQRVFDGALDGKHFIAELFLLGFRFEILLLESLVVLIVEVVVFEYYVFHGSIWDLRGRTEAAPAKQHKDRNGA